MFTVTLPYPTGTFVKITNPKFTRQHPIAYGIVTGYNVFSEHNYTIHISDLNSMHSSEYFSIEVEALSTKEVNALFSSSGHCENDKCIKINTNKCCFECNNFDHCTISCEIGSSLTKETYKNCKYYKY